MKKKDLEQEIVGLVRLFGKTESYFGVEDEITNLRIFIKYTLFDLEATKRELKRNGKKK